MIRLTFRAALALGASAIGWAPAQSQPVSRTVTVMPAGPNWLAAASDYPTNFVVRWTAVSGASAYRIWRWQDGAVGSKWARDVNAAGLASPTEPGYAMFADKYRTQLGSTYSYQVEALFVDVSGTTTISTSSPVGSAQSVPFLAPTNLRYTTSPGASQHEVRLLLSFDQVPAAQLYYFTGTSQRNGWPGPQTLKSSTVLKGDILFDASGTVGAPPGGTLLRIPIYRKYTYVLCLSTIYPDWVRDDTVKNCVTVPL